MALLETLFDDFAGAAMDTSKWAVNALYGPSLPAYDSAVTIAQSSGQLVITLLANTAASTQHYNGYDSVATYDLTNSYALVRLATVSGSATSAESALYVGFDHSDNYRVLVSSSTIYFQPIAAGTRTTTFSATYSSTSHQWVCLRHGTAKAGAGPGTGDTVYMDTAPDSGSNTPGAWTNRGSVARGITITGVIGELSAGTWNAVTSPGNTHFDNFNVTTGVAPAGPSLRKQPPRAMLTLVAR